MSATGARIAYPSVVDGPRLVSFHPVLFSTDIWNTASPVAAVAGHHLGALAIDRTHVWGYSLGAWVRTGSAMATSGGSPMATSGSPTFE